MKPPVYRIRITGNAVSVQHRARTPSGELLLLAPIYALIIYFNDGFRIMANLVRTADWGTLCVVFFFNCAFVILFSWSWLLYSSGEFMHCDAKELQIGTRRFWTRWHRNVFPMQTVQGLKYTRRGSSKTRSYSVLAFRGSGKQIDILEDISLEDALRVLKACKALGYDCILPEIFPNYDGPMNADIGKRGWLVNPWRPDPPANHPND